MELNKKASIFIPDGSTISNALKRTTDLCIAAHQDDTEIMAYHAIAEAYDDSAKWFTSVIITDGGGSPRDGIYKNYSDERMKHIRASEQNTAATVGKYSAQIQLKYSSSSVREFDNPQLTQDLIQIITACKPEILYTHNLCDKHDTHVAVAMQTIKAVREIKSRKYPDKFYGLEVWRSLDWLIDNNKTVFDASKHENLSFALLGVFDSQICGGKRYDLATVGRRRANATFLEDHGIDHMTAAIYGLDMTRLLVDPNLSPEALINEHIENFKSDTLKRIKRLQMKGDN